MEYPTKVYHVEHGPAFVASREEFAELEIRLGKGWNPDPVAAARGESVSPETSEEVAAQIAAAEAVRAAEEARVVDAQRLIEAAELAADQERIRQDEEALRVDRAKELADREEFFKGEEVPTAG